MPLAVKVGLRLKALKPPRTSRKRLKETPLSTPSPSDELLKAMATLGRPMPPSSWAGAASLAPPSAYDAIVAENTKINNSANENLLCTVLLPLASQGGQMVWLGAGGIMAVARKAVK